MTCPTCNHANKKEPERTHLAGQCERCNCGQSEIVSRPAMSGSYYINGEHAGPQRISKGAYRVFEAPTQR